MTLSVTADVARVTRGRRDDGWPDPAAPPSDWLAETLGSVATEVIGPSARAVENLHRSQLYSNVEQVAAVAAAWVVVLGSDG